MAKRSDISIRTTRGSKVPGMEIRIGHKEHPIVFRKIEIFALSYGTGFAKIKAL